MQSNEYILQNKNRTMEESSSEVPYCALTCANRCDMGMIMAEYVIKTRFPLYYNRKLQASEC